MLAIMRALEEWQHFLEGAQKRVEIWTDHRNLQYFMTAKKLNRRQACWSLYLSCFDFEMHHRPGRTMGKSDALSHRSDHGTGINDKSDIVLLWPKMFAVRVMEAVKFEGEERDVVRDIHGGIRAGQIDDLVVKAVEAIGSAGGRSLQSAEWRKVDGLLYFHDQLYGPNDSGLCCQIVAQHHDSRIAGHAGRWKTLELVSRSYWWPTMSCYIGSYCRTCDLCLRTKVQHRPPMGKLHPLPIPEE